MSKKQAEFEARQKASRNKIYLRPCKICGLEIMMAKNQKYCSAKCKGKVQYFSGKKSTEEQYKEISGNWPKYLQKLLYFHGRHKNGLTLNDLLSILENQNFKCALSGEQLTCLREKGKQFWTNASIDRIQAGGAYNKQNIQLVCRALNGLRRDMNVDQFILWCQKVAEWQQYKQM